MAGWMAELLAKMMAMSMEQEKVVQMAEMKGQQWAAKWVHWTAVMRVRLLALHWAAHLAMTMVGSKVELKA